jgi:hypothetical protein
VFVASLLTQRDNDSNLEGCIFLNLILSLSLRRVPFPPKTLTRAQPEERFHGNRKAYIYSINGRIIIIMTRLVTFTPREAESINHYLQRVIPRGREEETELVKLIQQLKRILIKLDDI